MPTPKQQRRRALELLEASIDGCTEAIMLAFCVSGDRCGDAVGFSLSTRRQCNGRRQAERDRQKIAAIPASPSILPRSPGSRVRTHARFFDHAGSTRRSRCYVCSCCLRLGFSVMIRRIMAR